MESNDTILAVLKSNKCETRWQKITVPLTNERHVLIGSYFYTHVSHLLGFDTDDVISFDTKCFFVPGTPHNVETTSKHPWRFYQQWS